MVASAVVAEYSGFKQIHVRLIGHSILTLEMSE